MYLLRFHSPFFSAALAGAMLRAAASSSATASSAAVTMLDVGALTTMTPPWVAAVTSTLSRPTPARATTFRLLGGGDRLGVDLGGAADEDRVDVGDGGQQLGAVGAVAGADLEVGAERLDGGGGELFGDEYDRLGHEMSSAVGRLVLAWLSSRESGRARRCARGPTLPDRPQPSHVPDTHRRTAAGLGDESATRSRWQPGAPRRVAQTPDDVAGRPHDAVSCGASVAPGVRRRAASSAAGVSGRRCPRCSRRRAT